MEDGDIVEVHMEQIGGGGPHREKLQEWVEVEPAVSLLQQVCNEKYMMRLENQKVREEKQQVSEEKARLMIFNDQLKRELAALKINNRALARDNNIFKVSLKPTILMGFR
jgi:ribonucleotide reductase alpha subunit